MDASIDLCLTAESPASVAPAARAPAKAERRATAAAGADEQLASGRRLRESLFNTLIDSGSLAVAAIEDGCIRFASPGLLRLLGLPSLEGQPATAWCRRVHPADRERVVGHLLSAMAGAEVINTECLLTQASGSAIRAHLTGFPAVESPSAYTLLLHVDVQSREALLSPRLPAPVQRAFAQRRNDVLDRASDLLVDAWLKSQSLGVLAVAPVAPPEGWSIADRLQAEDLLLERLQPCLRAGDAIGRHGDEGLLIVIPDLGGAEAAGIVAGRLIGAVCQTADINAVRAAPALNIGIALFPYDDQELSGLLAHAAAALVLARQSGANRYSLAETSLNLTLQARAMPWDDSLSVGLENVDAQHGQLVERLRGISHDVAAGGDLAALHASVGRLKQALIADFRVEDAIMRDNPGPGTAAHRKDHERALRNLQHLERADPRQGVALSAQFLHGWMREHIREHDAPLVRSTYRSLW